MIKYLSTGIGAVSGLLGVVFILVALGSLPNTAGMKETEAVSEVLKSLDFSLNGFFYICYFGVIFCAAFAVLYGVYQAATAPKKAMGSIIGIAALGLILFISYAMADDSVNWIGKSPEEIKAVEETFTSGARRFSGASVNAMYILLAASILTIIFAELYRYVRSISK